MPTIYSLTLVEVHITSSYFAQRNIGSVHEIEFICDVIDGLLWSVQLP